MIRLTKEESRELMNLIEPLQPFFALPGTAVQDIRNGKITEDYLNVIQRHIDCVLFTAGRPANAFGFDEAAYLKLQRLAAAAHHCLRHRRRYVWDGSGRD